MKGRKSIPSKILQLRGGVLHTHKAKSARADEPRPPEKMPSCPKHLNKNARKEWRRAGKILQDVGLMTELDMAVLAGYCDAFAQWAEATVKVNEKGLVYVEGQKKDKNGQIINSGIPKLNPYLRVAREAYDRMMKAAVLIGLSPSSRANLKVEKPKRLSKAEAFRASRNGE